MNELFDVQQMTPFEFGAIVVTVLIAGLVFGCLIAYGLLKRKNSPQAAAAVKIQEEFEQYKEQVDDHFKQTSEMFKDVTTQYKKLYDHMAVGAIELGNADMIAMPRLEMQDDNEDSDLTVNNPEPDPESADDAGLSAENTEEISEQGATPDSETLTEDSEQDDRQTKTS